MCLLFEDKEITPTRNVKDARAQRCGGEWRVAWNHQHSALAYYTLHEMFNVFSPCVLAELSLLPIAV
jgi:hypothetical protein